MNEELLKEFWSQVNEIEELSCKLTGCQSIITICAERTCSDESGALWTVADILNEIENKLDNKVYKLLEIYRELKEPVKKAKKK
jgi:hypothetical protein